MDCFSHASRPEYISLSSSSASAMDFRLTSVNWLLSTKTEVSDITKNKEVTVYLAAIAEA
jgi:hypothetical protein